MRKVAHLGLCQPAIMLVIILSAPLIAMAQPRGNADAPEPQPLVIKRDAIHIIPPENFNRPISLKPTKQLTVRALVEGIVQSVRVEPGAKVSSREELIRIESSRTAKQLERAKANLKAATIKRDLMKSELQAGKQPQAALDLAEAELEVAEADLDLAQLDEDNTSVRAPFEGEILSVQTVEGAFVDAGDALIEMRDTRELSVRLPVNRNEVKRGDTIEVTLDKGTVQGTVQTILPLTEEWQSLRQLIDTAAIAVVVIKNDNGVYQDGQTAYSKIVPRQPVIEVANNTLKSSEAGTRTVHVIRDSVVREIEVDILSPVGEGRSYVSGPFHDRDEVINETSIDLAIGTVVVPANPAAGSPQGRPGAPRQGAQGGTTTIRKYNPLDFDK